MRISLLAGLAVIVCPPMLGAQSGAFERAIHDTTLANGLQVIAVENHAVPLVTAVVAVRTGAFTQEKGDEGVSHLFERMLFKSYREGDGRSFEQRVGEMDGRYSGGTTTEGVTYYIVAPSKHFDDVMTTLAELVRYPRFTDDELQQERQVFFDGFHRAESDPRPGSRILSPAAVPF